MLDTLPASATQTAVWAAIGAAAADKGHFTLHDIESHLDNLSPALRIKARSFVWAQTRAGRLATSGEHDPRFSIIDSTPPAEAALVAHHALPIQIPRTYAGLWAVMQWFDRERKGFSALDVLRIFGHEVDPRVVRAYIEALERGRYLDTAFRVGTVQVYRVVRRSVDAPRLARDGVLLSGPRRTANMWRSMKMLAYFTALDLASAASLPELPITVEQAQRYITALVDAEYLGVRARKDEPTLYRLKNSHNTGPAAPEVLRTQFVWDANLCRVVTPSARAEEVRP